MIGRRQAGSVRPRLFIARARHLSIDNCGEKLITPNQLMIVIFMGIPGGTAPHFQRPSHHRGADAYRVLKQVSSLKHCSSRIGERNESKRQGFSHCQAIFQYFQYDNSWSQ